MGATRAMTDPVTITVPGDKSISHRALFLASMATGESRIRGILTGEDVQSTASVLRASGCAVPPLGEDVRVEGCGLLGWRASTTPLDCGNSGTTARLLLGALAAHPFRSVLTGDASLRSRPMRRVTEPLARAGARFEELGLPDRLPIRITGGPLQPIRHRAAQASAQVKSALLLAGLEAGVPVALSEPRLSRDHTERMLAAMGVPISVSTDPVGTARIGLEPGATPHALDLVVPGDFSSAAFFLALGLAGRRPVLVTNVGINPTRTGFLNVVRRMGGEIHVENERESGGEPVADILAVPSPLRGAPIHEAEIPTLIDEIPILAVLGACADGETTVRGAAELRVKESDRLAVLVTNLRELGHDADEFADGMAVRGGTRPGSGTVRVHADHRIAMAFGVLRAITGAAFDIDEPAVAGVSFPGFWNDLQRVTEGA